MKDLRPIPDYDGYHITTDGQVYSDKTGKWLKTPPNSHGHPQIRPRRNGQQPTIAVHRLVALTFIGPPPPGKPNIRHLDGNPANNRLDNLAYGTPSQTSLDTVRHGTHAHAAKTHCPKLHPLAGANLITERQGAGTVRRCRTCRNSPKESAA